MSQHENPVSRRSIGLASVCLLSFCSLILVISLPGKSLEIPAIVSGPLTALLLLGWVVFGRFEWKRIHRIGEVELRIRTDAAFFTHHVTIGALVVLLIATEFWGLSVPSLLNMGIAYMGLSTGAELFLKNRLT